MFVFKPDFMKNANNVYRTKYYIIKQVLSINTDMNGSSTIHSDDFYYLRTKHLDKLFEFYFGNRLVINGKRLHSTAHTKKYM